MILLEEGAISKAGFNGPYENSSRQKGFVNFGVSHVMRILGSAEQAQASSWYQKWNVHLLARPEVRVGTDQRRMLRRRGSSFRLKKWFLGSGAPQPKIVENSLYRFLYDFPRVARPDGIFHPIAAIVFSNTNFW